LIICSLTFRFQCFSINFNLFLFFRFFCWQIKNFELSSHRFLKRLMSCTDFYYPAKKQTLRAQRIQMRDGSFLLNFNFYVSINTTDLIMSKPKCKLNLSNNLLGSLKGINYNNICTSDSKSKVCISISYFRK
jgi:hypothetical protein